MPARTGTEPHGCHYRGPHHRNLRAAGPASPHRPPSARPDTAPGHPPQPDHPHRSHATALRPHRSHNRPRHHGNSRGAGPRNPAPARKPPGPRTTRRSQSHHTYRSHATALRPNCANATAAGSTTTHAQPSQATPTGDRAPRVPLPRAPPPQLTRSRTAQPRTGPGNPQDPEPPAAAEPTTTHTAAASRHCAPAPHNRAHRHHNSPATGPASPHPHARHGTRPPAAARPPTPQPRKATALRPNCTGATTAHATAAAHAPLRNTPRQGEPHRSHNGGHHHNSPATGPRQPAPPPTRTPGHAPATRRSRPRPHTAPNPTTRPHTAAAPRRHTPQPRRGPTAPCTGATTAGVRVRPGA